MVVASTVAENGDASVIVVVVPVEVRAKSANKKSVPFSPREQRVKFILRLEYFI